MPFARIRWLLSGLLLVASVAAAGGQVVYKWKDPGGNVHFTDTAPPPGATLLKGPKPVPVVDPTTERDDKAMLHMPCRSDIGAADCDTARRSLQADLEDLERTSQQTQGNGTTTLSNDEAKRQVTTLRANECSMWRDVLASLEDRLSDTNTGRLTASARAAMPAQIADAKQRIARSCD